MRNDTPIPAEERATLRSWASKQDQTIQGFLTAAGHLVHLIDALDAADSRLATERDEALGKAATAWDEGFTRGFYDSLAGGSRDASESPATNPYEAG